MSQLRGEKNTERKNQQTVQTLLAAKKGKSDNLKDKAPPAKRLVSDLSMDSSSYLEMSTIQHDLESIKCGLEGVVKIEDLNKAISDVVKKGDLEHIVTSIVTKLLESMKTDLEQKFKEKTDQQSEGIEGLTLENEQLRELIAYQRRTIQDLEDQSC